MPLIRSKREGGQRVAGYTLLEVMVALVIFSIGLLGLAGLQSQSLRYNHSAYLQTQASYLAYDILDRMRANRQTALDGGYNATDTNMGSDKSCNTTSTSCSTGDMALHDIYEWKTLLGDMLPEGTGAVDQNGDVFTISIEWEDPGTPDDKNQYQLRSRI